MQRNMRTRKPTYRSGRNQQLLFALCVMQAQAFAPRLHSLGLTRTMRLHSEAEGTSEASNNADDEILFESTVKIDDHGSDLTDRFKYKVNALMGVFDPPTETDNERAQGNILNAMLNFPVYYSFNVVGRTNNDATQKDAFVEAVKEIVKKNSGKQDVACSITPRGNNFTKVTVEAQVESTAIITSTYKELETLENAVMRF